MPSFDYFRADLRCPVCGQASTLQVQTKIGPQDMDFLQIGDDTGATVDDVRSFYYELRTPDPDGPVHVMVRWDCRRDHSGFRDRVLWAVVTIKDGRIEAIRDVQPDRQELKSIHFVDDDAVAALNRHFGQRLELGRGAYPEAAESIAEAIRRDDES